VTRKKINLNLLFRSINHFHIIPDIWNVCGNKGDDFHQISPGVENYWPWMASLGEIENETWKWKHICGATLITKQFLLSAAHCVTSGNPLDR